MQHPIQMKPADSEKRNGMFTLVAYNVSETEIWIAVCSHGA